MATLTYGSLSLPLQQTAFGPLVDTSAAPVPALAWILNAGVGADLPGLRDAVERGEDVATPYLAAHQPGDDVDLTAAAEMWRGLTGEDLGGETYVLDVSFVPEAVVVSRTALAQLLTDLLRRRAEAPKPPAPWLFRREPLAPEPAPSEEAMLRELEMLARTVDAEGASQADRRQLLQTLDACGFFMEDLASVRRACLEGWDLPILTAYAEAADELRGYLASDERRVHLGPVPSTVVDANISVDWFRLKAPTPARLRPYEWAGFCERLVRDAPIASEDDVGEAFTRTDPGWVRTLWRRDFGRTPAAVRAEVLTGEG